MFCLFASWFFGVFFVCFFLGGDLFVAVLACFVVVVASSTLLYMLANGVSPLVFSFVFMCMLGICSYAEKLSKKKAKQNNQKRIQQQKTYTAVAAAKAARDSWQCPPWYHLVVGAVRVIQTTPRTYTTNWVVRELTELHERLAAKRRLLRERL